MKSTLREQLKIKLNQLPEEYRYQSDTAIYRQVVSLPQWQNAQVVFCYVSVCAEPDTRRFIQTALDEGKRVCVPRCHGGGVMQASEITRLSQLQPAGYGLLEPDETAPQVPPAVIELALVPCVAADQHGWRLGHGGGYYDRYLPLTNCPSICLCRGRMLQNKLPREALDYAVTMVVTEDGCWPR